MPVRSNFHQQNKQAAPVLPTVTSCLSWPSVVLKGMMGTRPSSEEYHRNEKGRKWGCPTSSRSTSHYSSHSADSRIIINLHWVTGLSGRLVEWLGWPEREGWDNWCDKKETAFKVFAGCWLPKGGKRAENKRLCSVSVKSHCSGIDQRRTRPFTQCSVVMATHWI